MFMRAVALVFLLFLLQIRAHFWILFETDMDRPQLRHLEN